MGKEHLFCVHLIDQTVNVNCVKPKMYSYKSLHWVLKVMLDFFVTAFLALRGVQTQSD